jgi:hypothetical protein
LQTCKGSPSTAAKAIESRSIVPLPLFKPPSTSINQWFLKEFLDFSGLIKESKQLINALSNKNGEGKRR